VGKLANCIKMYEVKLVSAIAVLGWKTIAVIEY